MSGALLRGDLHPRGIGVSPELVRGRVVESAVQRQCALLGIEDETLRDAADRSSPPGSRPWRRRESSLTASRRRSRGPEADRGQPTLKGVVAAEGIEPDGEPEAEPWA